MKSFPTHESPAPRGAAATTSTSSTSSKPSSKPAATDNAAPLPAPRMPAPAERECAVRELAYAFFEARGRTDGHELDDWLKAEAQILGPCVPTPR
jgi:hypothetical protein